MNNSAEQTLSWSFNAPNAVTIVRVVLAIVIAWLLLQGGATEILLAGILLIVGWTTDGLDGLLARRMGQSTLAGALFDLVADRMLTTPHPNSGNSWGTMVTHSRSDALQSLPLRNNCSRRRPHSAGRCVYFYLEAAESCNSVSRSHPDSQDYLLDSDANSRGRHSWRGSRHTTCCPDVPHNYLHPGRIVLLP